MMLKMMGATRDQTEAVMAHELNHALQDQTWNILEAQKSIRDNSDEVAAIKSIIEGEAKNVEWDFTFGGKPSLDHMAVQQQMNQTPWQIVQADSQMGGGQFKGVPPYLVETLTFPYFPGAKFVNALRKEGGWETVNAAWKNPPRSTEQILHPKEKFLGENREDPSVVEVRGIGPALGIGWKKLTEDTLGEYSIGFVIRRFTDNKVAAARVASEGWQGDRFYVYRHEDAAAHAPILVWVSTWDSEKDAREFTAAYGAALAKKHPNAHSTPRRDGAGRHMYVFENKMYACAVKGTTVVVVEGAAEQQLKALEGVFDRATISPYAPPTVEGTVTDGDTGVEWYENRMLDLRLPLDREGWALTPGYDPKKGPVVMADAKGAARVSFDKLHLRGVSVKTNAGFGAKMVERAAARVANLKNNRVKEATVGGRPGVVVEFIADIRGKTRFFAQAWTKAGKNYYILTATADPKDQEAARGALDHWMAEAEIG